MTKKYLNHVLPILTTLALAFSLAGCSASSTISSTSNEQTEKSEELNEQTEKSEELIEKEQIAKYVDPTFEILYSNETTRGVITFYCVNKIDNHAYLLTLGTRGQYSQRNVDITPLTNDDGTPMTSETLRTNIDKYKAGN